MHEPIYSEAGDATWYTAPYKGRKAANGQPFDDHAFTAAQRTLPLGTGLGWKLAVAPLIIMTVGTLLHINASIHSVALLEAGMAPMVTVAILAEQGNLDSPLANTMVGFGILASFITVPLWNLML